MSEIEGMSRTGTGTKKIGCPFMLQGVKLKKDDDWGVKVICGSHNHPPAEQLEGHSFAGRLSKEEETMLIDMTKNMIRPRNILLAIKEKNKENVSTMRTIYNARHRHKIVEKTGRSQMQQLMKKLYECKYVEWHRSNYLTDCIRDLFWAHPSSVDILHAFPSVLIMDCTYKTNRYGLPLLEIVGVTCTDLTFTIAFVYMEAEREENYTWAMEKLKGLMPSNILPKVILTDRDLALMNPIKRVFPEATNLLCRWHIMKNVLAHSRKIFRRKKKYEAFMLAWGVLVLSSSENDYAQNLESLDNDYKDYPRILKYIKDTWLIPYKERFVAAWTDRVMHFGNLTTNRAESAHATLKRWLGSSQGDFDSSWNTINSLIELQHTQIRASFEQSLNVVEHNFKPTLFRDLRGLISRKALNEILDESKRANNVGVDITLCKCIIKSTHGLPCAHEIAECQRNLCPISISKIHPHWLKLNLEKSQPSCDLFEVSIDDEMKTIWSRFHASDEIGKLTLKRKLRDLGNPATTFLTPPLEKCKTKGRPLLKKFGSTRRDPSYFEVVEAELSEKPVTIKKPKKQTVRRPNRHMRYLNSFPFYIQPHIRGILDVEADGHCGFRAIAGQLGFGEDCWLKVREDLVEELCHHRSYYTKFYGSGELVAQLLKALSYFTIPAPYENWMSLPDMGHLVATRYNVVFISISKQQSCTYLPLRSSSPPPPQCKIIAIGFVNGSHFVQVLLDNVAPIPPIVPNWRYCRLESAAGWDIPFLDRINEFKALLPIESNSGCEKIINLDDP
ncbi:PKS-NRPS hybrid synthetase cheA-like [Salvia miltiorrhiza]|uniref:PKS-NRPS hybrid synthetase cheA-like n=1 Tax=Salvia miltiorrhiza TaxID=226208 RepID=UPI0025ABF312|nr:PKS-NRPS hybrid synthetase cheA-like [Salvia miltiorrhiza]